VRCMPSTKSLAKASARNINHVEYHNLSFSLIKQLSRQRLTP
jgi:hypothetical protein